MNFSSGFNKLFLKVSKMWKTCKRLNDSLYYRELFPAAKQSYYNVCNRLDEMRYFCYWSV